MSIQSVSVSVSVKPVDYRCRFWAKVVRGGVVLPVPNKVLGANDVPGAYLKQGDEELFAGDFLLIGEEVHHRKARGWDYKMKFIDPRTGQLRTVAALSERTVWRAYSMMLDVVRPGCSRARIVSGR